MQAVYHRDALLKKTPPVLHCKISTVLTRERHCYDTTNFRVLKLTEGQAIIDEDHTILADGEPFFPLGIYHVKPHDYEKVADIGFNMVQMWSWHFPDALDKAKEYGLRALVEFNDNTPERFVNQWYSIVGNHPATAMLYVADEPKETWFTELEKRISMFHIMDLNHPGYMASNSGLLLTANGIY